MALSNQQVKHIRSLHRKKFRNKENQFIVEGVKIVDEVVRSQLSVELLVLTPTNENLQNVYPNLPAAITDEKTFAKLSNQTNAAGVLAVVNKPDYSFSPDELGQLTLMLDDINDPGNLGTILRTADWFGIQHIICSEETVDLYNPKTIQSTMGSIARVKVFYLDLPATLAQLTDQFNIMGLFMQGEPVDTQKSNKKSIIVTGNEANGISKSVQPYIHTKVSIPRFSNKNQTSPESLNASIATSIVCYELTKRK